MMNCPYCNKDNPLHTAIAGETNPVDDDISICIGCGNFSLYTDNVTSVRKPSPIEVEAFKGDRNLWKQLQLAKIHILIRNKKIKE